MLAPKMMTDYAADLAAFLARLRRSSELDESRVGYGPGVSKDTEQG
jgi:hypothetical protein